MQQSTNRVANLPKIKGFNGGNLGNVRKQLGDALNYDPSAHSPLLRTAHRGLVRS